MAEKTEIRYDTGFGLIHRNIMRDKKLSIESKAIYGYISSFAGTGMVAYPGISLMCSELNISEKRFHKYKKELLDNGYLSIEREDKGKGFSKNVYTLHVKPTTRQIVPLQNVSLQNVSLQNDLTNNNSSNNNSINNNSINNNSATNVASELENQLTKEFEDWYNLYDKKKDRKAAFTKFKTARKKHSYEEIVKGTKEYLKTITDKQYQKYPKTFLNNESYLDDYSNDIKNNESSYLDKVLNKEDPFDEVL